MIKLLFKNGSKILTQQQKSIFSAALIIMVMIAASRILGLLRNRVLAHFFSPETLSIYFSAFRLPETIFEVLIFGTLSSAFIPTFTAYLSKREEKEAWYITSVVINLGLIFFLILATLFFVLSRPLYQLIAPGFSCSQRELIVNLSRILLIAQGFFVLSYFLTAVLESFQRFLIPAISPLFYNLGIILGTIFLAKKWGIYAPTLGAVIGAFFHFLIQLPLAYHLGFRPSLVFNVFHPGVRKIGKLALPRILELSFLQISKSAELFLASLVSTAAYTYYTFANSLQLLPVGLFGTSIAKAALPSLSYQNARGDQEEFKNTLISLVKQIIFLTLPLSVFLVVLRIPLVRLVFGAAQFTWESTVQTGLTVSAFCLGIAPQSLVYLLNRAFYAFHDTKTPVKISIITMLINILLGAIFILLFKLPIWSLALAFSLAVVIQVLILTFSLRKMVNFSVFDLFLYLIKISFCSLISGGIMFFFLKVLDRSVWDKRLSFLGKLGLALPVSFDRFVLDTRYTVNLIFLTIIVGALGLITYFCLIKILKIEELKVLIKLLVRFKRPIMVPPISPEKDG
ncbi:MAG: murein biosynthesis integral membrane protein MurJ [Microgenomates group bacterium]